MPNFCDMESTIIAAIILLLAAGIGALIESGRGDEKGKDIYR